MQEALCHLAVPSLRCYPAAQSADYTEVQHTRTFHCTRTSSHSWEYFPTWQWHSSHGDVPSLRVLPEVVLVNPTTNTATCVSGTLTPLQETSGPWNHREKSPLEIRDTHRSLCPKGKKGIRASK